MKKITINGKKQYVCLRNKKDNKIYYLGTGMDDGEMDSPSKVSKDNLNFNDPFDI